MEIQLSEHFDYKKLFKFTFPSIIMMIFTSIYGVIDGFFVSNFAGKTAFTAVNFVMPVLMILGSVGFMFGTGGSAIIAKTMGMGKNEEAQKQFSMLVYASAVSGVILAVLGVAFIRPLTVWLGAEGEMLEQGVLYATVILATLPAPILQVAFQSFFITAEKPDLGLKVTVAAGVANIVLDALLVPFFGIVGAAVATAVSQIVGAVIPLVYFARKNKSTLRISKPTFNGKVLLDTCVNGSSELLSNLAMSSVGMLYNVQLLKYAGEDGVAAYGVLMYVTMIFIAIFLGYAMGSAPIVSYHYGAENHSELKSLRKKSIVIISSISVVMLLLAELLAKPMAMIFASYDKELFEMTVQGFYVYSFSFLFCGLGIWSSSFFTALNNGIVSTLISFLRTMVFQVATVFILPLFFGVNGIWLSVVVGEALSLVVSFACLAGLKKKYKY
ncbi:MAG: MATE family efflux transporter [Oscillospiraceae bacterium]|nr:MATE family efflux transporter [Oscillospiraceae bacterium]